MKTLESLTTDDLHVYPLWKFADEDDDTTLEPVVGGTPSDLSGLLIGTPATLADGSKVWALVGNVDAHNPISNEHFLTFSIERDGQWFHLARYHDVEYDHNGPDALARFLQKQVSDIFPIAYDLGFLAVHNDSALKGLVRKEPLHRLTMSELIAMAVR